MADGESAATNLVDRFSIATGRIVAWLTLLMVLATVFIVVLRYAFDTGVIWLQESVTWMHAVVFMMGAAYTLQREDHVRVDVFYRDMSERQRALVNLFGTIFFIAPLCIFFIIESIEYVSASWSIREVSRNAGGLPYPFVPMLKSTLLLMPIALLLQGTSLALRSITVLRRC